MADIEDEGLFIVPDTPDFTGDDEAAETVPKYLMPDSVYNVLKWIGLVLMPALAMLAGSIGPAWGMPNVDSVVLTINALGTFIGVCIGASQLSMIGL